MAKIVVFTDFDGTLTSVSGYYTVFGSFYQSLLEGYTGERNQDYKLIPLISAQEIQDAFVKKFGVYHSDFDYNQADATLLLNAASVAFLKQTLNNPNVKICIITKNREEYIRALMIYQGFTPKEINNVFFDESGAKHTAVQHYLMTLEKNKSRPDFIYVLDDSPEDLEAMDSAARHYKYGYQEEQVRTYHHKPGEFKWKEYLDEIENLHGHFVPIVIKTSDADDENSQSKGIHADTMQELSEPEPVEVKTTYPDEENSQSEDSNVQEKEICPTQNNTLNFKPSTTDSLPTSWNTKQKRALCTTFSGLGGFVLGIVLGVALIFTKVLTVTTFGVLPLVALTLFFGVILGFASGVISYSLFKYVKNSLSSDPIASHALTNEPEPDFQKYPHPLSKLGGGKSEEAVREPMITKEETAKQEPMIKQEVPVNPRSDLEFDLEDNNELELNPPAPM